MISAKSLGGTVPIIEYYSPESQELAVAVINKIEHGNAAIIQCYGVVSLGKTIEDALAINRIKERTVQTQLISTFVGTPKILRRDELEILKKMRN